MLGQYRVKHPDMKLLYDEAQDLIDFAKVWKAATEEVPALISALEKILPR